MERTTRETTSVDTATADSTAKARLSKQDQLAQVTEDSDGKALTTNQGLRISDDQNTLQAGERGPSLLEDFHFREKITHFDHERIPERVVHARGSGAHGYFQVYEDLSHLTRAALFRDPSVKTPVFVRFSTVIGFRGSTDLARDVRGFATKFYTQEGVFDLVGNNMPVFFIQDAVKFPDIIHAAKPEPDGEMPQASSAHDTFWDFISLMPESAHMVMWVMSDRAIPRSFRMMEGFGVNTFRFVNAEGTSRFVKFHWKPLLGVHSVVWDEAQKISGKDPDFLRRDLWEAIETGAFPEWELGVQIVEEADEHKFDFDLLDATKLIPEELVPVQRIGRLTLNRNPENFFAEVEQVAFHPGHVVPGIDFSNDPLLQGRLFSYTDTQLLRLGGPNFHEIPINRSLAPVHNNQRDGFMRQTINRGKTSYEPNSIRGGCPMQMGAARGGYVSYPAPVRGVKERVRSDKFFDHFSQAALFFHSQSAAEQEHLVEALGFELGRVQRLAIRERMVGMLAYVDAALATRVASALGMPQVPKLDPPLNYGVPADAKPGSYEPKPITSPSVLSPALSMANTPKTSIATRQIAILTAEGVDGQSLATMRLALLNAGARPRIIAPHPGLVKCDDGNDLIADFSLLTGSPVLFDALYLPGGASALQLSKQRGALEWALECFRHFKPIAATGEGLEILRAALGDQLVPPPSSGQPCNLPGVVVEDGALSDAGVRAFLAAVAEHRHWTRQTKQVP